MAEKESVTKLRAEYLRRRKNRRLLIHSCSLYCVEIRLIHSFLKRQRKEAIRICK